jgi:hypothetical protein
VEAGLAAAGLDLDDAVARLARGLPAGIAHYDPEWPDVTRAQLCLVAPWLLLGRGLAYARGSRGTTASPLRLFSFPHQGGRKASVMLIPRRRPSLGLEWTQSHAMLARNLWQRPAVPGIWPTAQSTTSWLSRSPASRSGPTSRRCRR